VAWPRSQPRCLTEPAPAYLTPDPIVTSRSRMLAIGSGLKGSVIIMAHDPGAIINIYT